MPTSREIAAILAHQGGWDEALVIILPLAAIAGLLYLANRRADRRLAQQRDEAPTTTAATEASPSPATSSAAASEASETGS